MYSWDERDKFVQARADMVKMQLRGRDITDSKVLKVMGEIAREEFIPQNYHSQAYADCPVPIGMGQTISQPYIVALMTQALRVEPDCEVLEVGTGSGYQTAILAKLARKVYTIEKYNQLSESAQTVLARMGISNVEFYVGDGSCGWPSSSEGPGWVEEMTFKRIIITAAVPQPPAPLVGQLTEGGLLVAPVGGEYVQKLILCEKRGNLLEKTTICDCRFVKLVGKHGFGDSNSE
jgi:protein-L-isoaspartate(D-aspartate) O-methyltransferase